jgi:protein-S-isoprenylcysteine O-methyltransferase Ste14
VKELDKQALGGLTSLFVALAAALFIPAWSLYYWQAWTFLAVFMTSALAVTIYLRQNDPQLLERRVKAGPAAEQEPSQKIIQVLASISFIAVIVVPAIDHRLAWSSVPPYVVAAGDILIALGFFIVFLVFKENTYTSGTIEVAPGQTIITTGPYALVRHPMYIGAIILLVGIPLALGSWWGLLAVVPITAVVVWRLLDEERFLAKNLPGYPDYRNKVKYRLVPLIW